MDDFFFLFRPVLTLVGNCKIHHGKERFTLGAISPVCISAGLVPGSDRGGELVIGLYVVGAVIASCAEIFGEALDRRGRHALTAHILSADGGRVHTGDDSRTRRRTNTGVGVGVGIADALGCKLINVGCYCVTISITAEVGTNILAAYPEDIRPFSFFFFSIETHAGQQHRRR